MSTRRALHPKRLSLAVAQAMLFWLSMPVADAGVITLDGNYWTDPADALPWPLPDLYAPGVRLAVGSGGYGSFSMAEGAFMWLGQLSYGSNGSADGVIDGQGTLLQLDGLTGRLHVGGYGSGTLTLSNGAVIDGTVNAADCRLANAWCGASIAASAGSSGVFTLTGAGTYAAFLHGVDVANVYRDVNWGSSHGASSGTVQILDGAGLLSERAQIADSMNFGPLGQGDNESAAATVLIQGWGSHWTIANQGTSDDPVFTLGYGARSSATMTIADLGRLSIDAPPSGRYASLNIGVRGAQASLTVTNEGTIDLSASERSSVNIGQDGGKGTLHLAYHATLWGGQYIEVGVNGGDGNLIVDNGSLALLNSGAHLDVGNAGTGRLQVSNQSTVRTGTLNVGIQQGYGTVQLSDYMTTLSADNIDTRLNLENGVMTVTGGAVFDGSGNAEACLSKWCGSQIGSNAGNSASLTVSGSGSRVSLLDTLNVGGGWVTAPPATDWSNGTPGGQTRASIRVLDGGVLESQYASLSNGADGPAADGTEQASVSVLLQGAGSRWTVSGNALNGNDAWFNSGNGNSQGSSVDLRILGGAELVLGDAGVGRANLNLGNQSGYTNALVSGAGSRIRFASATNYLNIGMRDATANLSFKNGATLDNAAVVQVGVLGGNGTLSFDGAGTGASANKDTYAYYYVGDRGTGRMTVANGAVVDLDTQSTYLSVGSGWNGQSGTGTLLITGAGSQLLMRSQDNPTGPYTYNPLAVVGYGGSGQLTISNGGLLSLYGAMPNTAGDNNTALVIGHSLGGNRNIPTNGVATVTGANSRLRVTGADAGIGVGSMAQGNGQLNVLQGGYVETTALRIGDAGGIGRLVVDAGTVALSGQWRQDSGAALRLGYGAGAVGSAQLRNGAVIDISNAGDQGALLQIGSDGLGTLQMNSGSAITLTAAAGKAVVEINGAGSAVVNASTLRAVDGNVYIGGASSDTGALRLEDNARLDAAYVGVGTRHGADGGHATLIVNDSVLSAGTLEIGAFGYVGGSGTLSANIINRGVFNPGNSPGTLVVDGSFLNAAGGKLVLEVEANGAGGYNIDHLLFTNGAALDFSGLKVTFHFLGDTDPNAFLASGQFDIDNFIHYNNGDEVSHSLFGAATFGADADGYTVSNFSFSADGGAAFTAAPVPEPTTWAMLLAGLGLMRWRWRGKAGRQGQASC